jgi:hypothetical protein
MTDFGAGAKRRMIPPGGSGVSPRCEKAGIMSWCRSRFSPRAVIRGNLISPPDQQFYLGRGLRPLLALTFDFLVAAHFSLNFAQIGTPFLDLGSFMAGGERFPFQYRVFIVPIFSFLLAVFRQFDLVNVLPHLPLYLSSPTQLAYFTINDVSFFVALILFRKISARVFEPREAVLSYLLFIALSYLWFVLNPNLSFLLPYDLPALAFCQASVLCVLSGRWFLLCVIFSMVTVNRETTYLIPLLVAVRWSLNLERPPALILAEILTSIWIGIKVLLFLWLSTESQGAVIAGLRLSYNFVTLAKPWQWPSLWPLLLPVAFAAFGLRGSAHERQWSIVALAGFASLFCVANITELRAYGDIIGFVALSALIGLGARSGDDGRYLPESSQWQRASARPERPGRE